MEKMMINRMEKMSNEEKMEMMTKMMANENDLTCNDMMEKMSGMYLDDSLSMSDKASIMMPICFEHIFTTVEDSMKAQFLIDFSKVLIENGYDNIPLKDRPYFKKEMINTITGLG
ncbi:hypothetical protein GF312_03525 [Candidatus Poribacteria bacterium]|nr:hypothetical protein [Candidatus Poribacteria bacterium]